MSLIGKITGNIVTLHGADAKLRDEIERLKRDKRRTELQTVDPRLDGMPLTDPLATAEPVLVEITSVFGGGATARRLSWQLVIVEGEEQLHLLPDEEDEKPYQIINYPFGRRLFVGCRADIIPTYEHRAVSEAGVSFTAYWRVLQSDGDGFPAFVHYDDPEEIETIPTGPLAGLPLYPWSERAVPTAPELMRPHEFHWQREFPDGPDNVRAMGKAAWYAPGFDAAQGPRKLIPSGSAVNLRHEPFLGVTDEHATLVFTEVVEPESQVC